MQKNKQKKNKKDEINTSSNATMITNNTKNKYTSNISIMQHSKNILLQTSQPTINIILDNNRNNYMNDLKSANDNYNNNLYNNNVDAKSNYPLKSFLIINSETYLKYFVNINTKDFLKNSYILNNIMENNKTKNKIEDKYNIIENCKKSLLVLNKNKNSILGLLMALNKTNNKIYSKLLNTKLKFKIIHYEYYPRNPVILDYIISFMNNPILIFNDFKHSKKLFKNVIEA